MMHVVMGRGTTLHNELRHVSQASAKQSIERPLLSVYDLLAGLWALGA